MAAAKQHMRVGPAPDWTVPCAFRLDFKPKQPGHVTHLLCSKQIHAEKDQTFVHTAIRLETTQAVQNEAQGRIPFDPGSQDFTLHWLKVHRGETVFDRTSLENLHCVQKEADGFVAAGRLTLILLLEDVRPGDVVELCYTIQENSPLYEDDFGIFFALPEGAPLGKLYFSVRFEDHDEFQWKSSSPDLQPVETRKDDEVQWVWSRDHFPGVRTEENTPVWHINYPWIQVSDCPDWESVSEAYADVWDLEKADADLAAILPEIAGGSVGILQQIDRAIQLVQDQCRYLESDGELDDQPPTPPSVVARRRYGDSKDLSVLLMTLLKKLGLETRLVLVNTKFRQSLEQLLPMPGLFDHIVVEYSARGQTRWVDATAKGQGGGSLNRVISDFGVGLPVVAAGADLIEAPVPAKESNVYQIKESILLDTAGGSSILGIVVTAKGSHAEDLRREFETQGVEAIARRRMQMCVDRFVDVRRLSPLEYRDNRAENEFFLAEVFEIKDFLKEDAQASFYRLEIAAEDVAGALPLPTSVARHSPFALPHPCQMVHVLEIYCVALPPAIVQQRTIENPWVHFSRTRKTLAGNWTVTTTLSALTDSVPPDGMDEYREALREIRAQSTWTLQVPKGQPRPHQRSDFGRLPGAWESPVISLPEPSHPRAGGQIQQSFQAPLLAPGDRSQPLDEGFKRPSRRGRVTTNPDGTKVEIRYRREKRHRRRSRANRKAFIWQAAVGCVLIVIILVLTIMFIENHPPKIVRTPNLPPEFQATP